MLFLWESGLKLLTFNISIWGSLNLKLTTFTSGRNNNFFTLEDQLTDRYMTSYKIMLNICERKSLYGNSSYGGALLLLD